jgi:hypothetical protein
MFELADAVRPPTKEGDPGVDARTAGPDAASGGDAAREDARIAEAGLDAGGNDAAAEARGPRVTAGLAVLYDFDEDGGATVADKAEAGPPVDLTIENVGATQRVPGGLRVLSPTRIRGTNETLRIRNACQATNEVTVEAWARSTTIPQGSVLSSAKIVHFGQDSNTINTMLSVAEDEYRFGVRTGADPIYTITTASDAATPSLDHLVGVRGTAGAVELWVNGQRRQTGNVPAGFGPWSTFPLVLANNDTSNAPWVGTLYLVAIYCRALTPQEIAQNFVAGP